MLSYKDIVRKIVIDALSEGYMGVVTYGSVFSEHCLIISQVCEELKAQCHVFMPDEDSDILKLISGNKYSTVIPVPIGRNLPRRARNFAFDNDMLYLGSTISIIDGKLKNVQ